MDQVPEGDRCTCEPKVEKQGKQYPPMAAGPDFTSVRGSTEGGAGGVGCLGGLEGAGWRRWLGYEKDEDEV